MSLSRPVTVDQRLVSNKFKILPEQESYTRYTYERITASGGNAQSWTSGQNLTFRFPQYDDSVWADFSVALRLRLNVVGSLDATSGIDPPVAVAANLHAYSSVALELAFLSGLLEDLSVSYGGTEIRQFDVPTQLFSLLHMLYTLLTVHDDQYQGDALANNYLGLFDQSDDAQQTPQGYAKSNVEQIRDWTYINESVHPYNLAIGSVVDQTLFSAPALSGLGGTQDYFPFQYTVEDSNSAIVNYYQPTVFNSNWQYRSSLIINPGNYTNAPNNSDENPELQPAVKNVVMTLKSGFFDDGFKKPANIPLTVTLRRGKGDYKILCGSSKADLLMSSGSKYRNQQEVNASSYQLVIDELDLYAKRLVLSETQKGVLYDTPTMIYDMPLWSMQQFDLTGTGSNIQANFTRLPQLMLVALIPKAHLVDPNPSAAHFIKPYSVFTTCRPEEKSFTELYANTSYGRIPSDSYEPAFAGGSVNTAQSQRAYEEFLKVSKNPRHPLGFKLWSTQYTWFPFIINGDAENPNSQAVPPGRSSISITYRVTQAAQALGGLDNADVALVVVGMEMNQMIIQDVKNVSMSV